MRRHFGPCTFPRFTTWPPQTTPKNRSMRGHRRILANLRGPERVRGIAPFVAERDGTIVGYADVQQSGYIDHFFVAAGATRQGVGSLLMDRIHVTALSAGLKSLFSDVSVTARPFFEHWGFEVEGRQSLVVNGVSLANFRMRKSRLTFKWSRRS